MTRAVLVRLSISDCVCGESESGSRFADGVISGFGSSIPIHLFNERGVGVPNVISVDVMVGRREVSESVTGAGVVSSNDSSGGSSRAPNWGE